GKIIDKKSLAPCRRGRDSLAYLVQPLRSGFHRKVPRVRRLLPILCLLVGFAVTRAEAQPAVPPNFVVEDVAPGAGFVVPVQATWLPDGRMLVVEKRGRIQVVKNGIKNAQPMWQGDNEVLDQQDRGFLSVA